MNKAFVEKIRNAVAENLKDKIVEVREVEKTNGVMYTGISIRTEGCNIAPTIYINEDAGVEENVSNILNAYSHSQPKGEIDIDWFEDYEQVKEKLAIMITSKPIKGLAKRKAPGFDDLYMHAYVFVNNSMLGMGHINIKTEHLKTWGISNAKLFADALKSAPSVTPLKQRSMLDTLTAMGVPVPAELMDNDPMTVVSNTESVLGAAAILYAKVKENTYMIPSSVHEVILVDGDKVGENAMLNAMIHDVNNTVLAPEEYLSNHAYRYNGKKWENVA